MLKFVLSVLFVVILYFTLQFSWAASDNVDVFTQEGGTDNCIKLLYNVGMAVILSITNICVLLTAIINSLDAFKKEGESEDF